MATKYLLRGGRLTAKKPKLYCALHKCGLTRNTQKRACGKCKHCQAMNDVNCAIITVDIRR